jgi:integrase
VDLQAARREARDHLRTGNRIDKTASRRTVADFVEAVLADYRTGTGTRKNHEVHKKEPVWKRRRYKPEKVHIPDVETWRKIVRAVRSEALADTAEESADFLEAEGALGLGQAELATLIWADVDMKLMQISVRRVKTGEPFTVPIYPQAKSLIERRKKITGEKQANRVFTIKDPKVALKNACKKLGLPQYSQRTFRKMFITQALRQGVNVITIASPLWRPVSAIGDTVSSQ